MVKGSASTNDDPRRADRIAEMAIPTYESGELPFDHYALLSLLFALVAVLFGVRIYSWLTLLFTMASFANQRFSQMESQNALASIMLVCLTFVATHFKAMGQPLITPFAPWLRNKQAEL